MTLELIVTIIARWPSVDDSATKVTCPPFLVQS